MTKKRLLSLLCEIQRREMEATSPKAARYWDAHWSRLMKLTRSLGWNV